MGHKAQGPNWGVYNSATQTLNANEGAGIQVDNRGRVMATNLNPVGSGAMRVATSYGQPARYNVNLITLADKSGSSLQVDVNGKLRRT